MCQTLTMAIHRTMCSSMKLLKYWLRKRRPGPMKAVSGRYNSLLVMCAIYRDTGVDSMFSLFFPPPSLTSHALHPSALPD